MLSARRADLHGAAIVQSRQLDVKGFYQGGVVDKVAARADTWAPAL